MKTKSSKQIGMNIIIVGSGRVGTSLVEQLTKEGHDITLIDKDASVVQDMTNIYDIMGLVGSGASYSVQMEAGIEEADLLIAVTESDELNLLCCTMAKRVGDCAAIARVQNPDYSGDTAYLREKLGLARILNPMNEASREIARILCLPTALEVHTFAHGQAEIIKCKLSEEHLLIGKAIAELGKEKITENVLICAVQRGEEVIIPTGDFVFEQGDVISFVSTQREGKNFLKKIGMSQTKQVRDTMIIGGGKAAFYLAKRLLMLGVDVKIIERDRKRCEELSVLLPKATIINGDGTDVELLKEEGIETAQSFVPLTGLDEENILLTLHAKAISDAKVITEINHINYKEVISGLDLGSVVYPKYITTEAIVADIRARRASLNSNVETIYTMFDSKAETVEFLVKESSNVTGVPLSELKLRPNLVIACIIHKGKAIFPTGSDRIMSGDTVIVVTTETGISDIQDILA